MFIDSMQLMNSSLDKLVKNISDEDFKCLVQEFDSENLEFLKLVLIIKDTCPYKYMNSFERFDEKNCLLKIFLLLYKGRKNW